jgi:hypothetical protein
LSGRSKAWVNEARQPSADAIPVYRGTETLIKYVQSFFAQAGLLFKKT